jgi:hypothetical protein
VFPLLKEPVIRWTVFMTLLLTVPALFFLFVVVMFTPAVFFYAGILYVIPKLFTGNIGESLSFIALLSIHALVYSLIYYLTAWLAAKLICLVQRTVLRGALLTVLVGSLFAVTRLPVYGSGGHGPMHWKTLTELLTEIQMTYGPAAPFAVYGTALLLVVGLWLVRLRRYHKKTLNFKR